MAEAQQNPVTDVSDYGCDTGPGPDGSTSQDVRVVEEDILRMPDYAGAARTGLRENRRDDNLPHSNFDPENKLPQRPCTATITPRGRPTSTEIFDSLKACNIAPSAVSCMQRKSSGEILLTFRNRALREIFLSNCSIRINDQPVVIQDIDKPLTYLNVYDAPHELPDSAIIERLTPYCEVLHFRRGKFRDPDMVCNGIRHYRVRVKQAIPSYLRFGKFQIVLKHDRQEETCRHCNQPGHYARSCRTEICFNCTLPGHQARACPQPVMCSICLQTGHRVRNCPFSWYRPADIVKPASEDEHIDVEGEPCQHDQTEQDEQNKQVEQTEQQHDEQEPLVDSDTDSDSSSDSGSSQERDINYTSATDEILRSRDVSPIPPEGTKQPAPKPQRTVPAPRAKNGRRPAIVVEEQIPKRISTSQQIIKNKVTPTATHSPSTELEQATQQLFSDTAEEPTLTNQHESSTTAPTPDDVTMIDPTLKRSRDDSQENESKSPKKLNQKKKSPKKVNNKKKKKGG